MILSKALLIACLILSFEAFSAETDGMLQYQISPKHNLEITLTVNKAGTLDATYVIKSEDGIITQKTTFGLNEGPFVFPKPDNAPKNLPSDIKFNDSDFLKSLNEDGLFTIRSSNIFKKQNTSVIILKDAIAQNKFSSFKFPEPELTKGDNRHLSIKPIKTSEGETQLLVSMADVGPDNTTRATGTILTNSSNTFHTVDNEWHDFKKLGSKWELSKNDKEIKLEGKSWKNISDQTINWQLSKTKSPFTSQGFDSRQTGSAWTEIYNSKYNPSIADSAVPSALSPVREIKNSLTTVTFKERSIKDPEYRKHLQTLNMRLDSQVIGQPEAINAYVSSLEARAVSPSISKPSTMLFLGTTGTGKTELAKAISKENYLDEKAFTSFNMGGIKNEANLTSIFGSSKGYEGGKDIPPFQAFLDQNPNGGVILFDEIGNMGTSAETKDSLLKTFYQMLDEGIWKNRDGVIYDLKKYTLIFTSNEGQEVFEGLSTDNARINAWKKHKTPENLSNILKNSGWPDALIARLDGNAILFKPLVLDERVLIAKNFATKIAKEIEANHGVKVSFTSNFFEKVANTFFSHEQGIRQMKIPTVTDLSSVIGQELFALYEKPEQLNKTTLIVDMDDKFEKVKGEQPKRSVSLKLTTQTPGVPDKVTSTDLTSKAPTKAYLPKIEKLRAAIHESGHAIANDPPKTGRYVRELSIIPKGQKTGAVLYDAVPNARAGLSRERAIAEIAAHLAGSMAEEIYFPGDSLNSVDALDTKEAKAIARQAINNGLGLNGATHSAEEEAKEINLLLNEGRERAKSLLKERWPALRSTAARLMKEGNLNQSQFESAVRSAGLNFANRGVKPFVNRNVKCAGYFDSLFDSFTSR